MDEIVANIPAPAVAEIRTRLAELKREHEVAIPLAVESGSRAWGFPSPDSDYDCRFIFVRNVDAYLSPWTRRDVIEVPLDPVYDVNGWELSKALKLMLKGNAVVVEWLQSPIVYEMEPTFRGELLDLARRHADRKPIGLHYLHLGLRQWRTYFAMGHAEVALKKIFYVLRPAAALRWMALHADNRIPPMNFVALMEQSDPPKEVSAYVADLLQRKAVTRELGQAPMPSVLADFVSVEFSRAEEWLAALSSSVPADARRDVEEFFRRTVRRLSVTP